MSYQAFQTLYNGESAVCLRSDQYEAYVLPDIGANLVAFRDTANQYRFLREPKPEEMEQFKERPMVHGIPVLFPPNRYQDGTFTLNGKVYRFPVNEPATGNHLHGFLYNRPWEVAEFGATDAGCRVVLTQAIDERHEAYAWFPHAFDITLEYTLAGAQLEQKVSITNKGADAMPCMLGFHTALNAPFAPGSSADDCTIKLTIGERWELTERMLPSGNSQPLSEQEIALQRDGVSPYFTALDHHYSALAQNGANRMELTDGKANVRLIYDAGTAYRHWMLYNGGASREFFCPEPQTGMVNAPNVDLPHEITGLLMIEPGETWTASSRFIVEKL